MNRINRKKVNMWAILNLLFFFATLFVNYLGSSGFFNNMGQKEVSDKYMTLVTPAGFAFSIWGVIYSLVFMTLIYFIIKRKDRRVASLIEKISPLFILSSLMNMGWIVLFSYELLGLSTLMIFGMLFSLLLIVERIYKNRRDLPYFLPGLAFSLYGAWVFIATILNISLYLVQQNWDGFGISDSIWTIIMLVAAIGLTLLYLFIYKNAVFPLSLAWAYFGIYNSYTSGVLNPPMAPIIQIVLLVGIGVFVLSSIVTFIKNKKSIFPKSSMWI